MKCGDTMKFNLVEEFDVEFDNCKNELSEEQVKFFKDSKIRNSANQLIVCYHGTTDEEDYSTISPKRSSYGTPSSFFGNNLEFAVSFAQRYGDRGNVYNCYLNIINPLVIDAEGADFYSVPLKGDKVHISEVARYAVKNNFDGVVVHNIKEYGNKIITDFITFEENQIKLVSNKAPTQHPNMNK